MDVHITPEMAKRLTDLAAMTGRGPAELVQDALAGHLEEPASLRDTLDSRYEDLKGALVRPIDGEEAFCAAAPEESPSTLSSCMSDYASHPEAFADLDRLWEYIAEHNLDAADRVIADIF